ncbi:Mini-ribonuclease 3 [Clostridium oryzae]|uniref:Mini-ribonuclease 3 n=1 Tax=Clostridium oryzae TaxID=1450648 RepID=UPI003BFA7290
MNNYFDKLLTKNEARRMNPLSLAFIGDAVFEIVVRKKLILENSELSAHKLHVKAISYVKAHAQSSFMKVLEAHLNDEENMMYKRGRNAKSPTVPKNANVTEYRVATGFETLMGYLYIIGDYKRIEELIDIIFNQQDDEKEIDKNGVGR